MFQYFISTLDVLSIKNTVDHPTAKKDSCGNLITNRRDLESLYLRTYETRLKPNEILEDLKELKQLKESQKQCAKLRRTDDWSMTELEAALKSMKNNKTMASRTSFLDMEASVLKDLY